MLLAWLNDISGFIYTFALNKTNKSKLKFSMADFIATYEILPGSKVIGAPPAPPLSGTAVYVNEGEISLLFVFMEFVRGFA